MCPRIRRYIYLHTAVLRPDTPRGMDYVVPERALVRRPFLAAARRVLRHWLHEPGLVELSMAGVQETACFADDPVGCWRALGREIHTLRHWSCDCSQIVSNSFGLSSGLYRTLRGVCNMMHLQSVLAECCPDHSPAHNRAIFCRPATARTSRVGTKRKRVPGSCKLVRTLTRRETDYIRGFTHRVQACCVYVRNQSDLIPLAEHCIKANHYIKATLRACANVNKLL